MQAIEAATFGAPDVLRLKDLAEPVARPGELLIAVSVSDILLVQLFAARGGPVIGAAGGKAKQEVVVASGAKAAIDYSQSDWLDAVLRTTGGVRPATVFDGVGGHLGSQAFEVVADGGQFSAHGSSSGTFAPIDADQAARRRVAVTTIFDLQYRPEDRTRRMRAALDELQDGAIAPVVGQMFPLADASRAHHAIETRKTVAKTLLLSGQ
jgi:NADPH2:quinone reductase